MQTKFTDDDFRAAVALLERMGFDTQATVQLVIVTAQFREMMGLETRHGERVKAS